LGRKSVILLIGFLLTLVILWLIHRLLPATSTTLFIVLAVFVYVAFDEHGQPSDTTMDVCVGALIVAFVIDITRPFRALLRRLAEPFR
jgi:multisubunit Na+/H+ antiporter MnhE subunit